jgi:hypothetical protein
MSLALDSRIDGSHPRLASTGFTPTDQEARASGLAFCVSEPV